MKKLTYLLLALFAMTAFVACNDDESYADQKKAERSAINKYIADSAVNVISETQFALQGNTTDVSKNEFVLFQSSGIYMQIVRKGCGKKIKSGETATVLVRFTERDLLTDTITLSNQNIYYGQYRGPIIRVTVPLNRLYRKYCKYFVNKTAINA